MERSRRPKIEDIELPYRVPTDINVRVWYLIFIPLLSVTLFVSISLIISDGFIGFFAGVFIVAMFGFIALKLGPTLLITKDGLSYREFFKHQRIPWASIEKIQTTTAYSFRTKYALKGGIVEMDIYHNDDKTENPIAINLKVFTASGLNTLAEVLARRAPAARLDRATEGLREGIMPSILAPPGERPSWAAAARWMAYVLLTGSLFILPVAFLVQDLRVRYGLPAFSILFFSWFCGRINSIEKFFLKNYPSCWGRRVLAVGYF